MLAFDLAVGALCDLLLVLLREFGRLSKIYESFSARVLVSRL